ncbi:LysM peptidoglycan-binding domain-containing protein [Synechococcus sp. PCC 7336]|uniref:CIS tube protein n=1 Tax=Synechococcus sp. PCC 7336 TaxID=195250 RepID=UPI00034A1925|nr:LysM peptidoglycan-binding domain-containing protein [Synechococcus sp. PCC 7336]
MDTGELTKVKIIAFKDKKYSDKLGEFDLPINPDRFSQSFKIEYDEKQATGSQGSDPKFKFTKPEELKLNFTFDGTGVVPVKQGGDTFHKDAIAQLQSFLSIVYSMNEATHKPNFLRLLWGNFSFGGGGQNGFDCILKDLQINYTLFAPDGKPLRVKLSATFLNYIEQVRRLNEQGKQSPDVTHQRTVAAGDKLPLMSHRIYGDADYYLQVAKVNGLVNFRRLGTNTDLRFPPTEKTEL